MKKDKNLMDANAWKRELSDRWACGVKLSYVIYLRDGISYNRVQHIRTNRQGIGPKSRCYFCSYYDADFI
jgi:hypothetical protein